MKRLLSVVAIASMMVAGCANKIEFDTLNIEKFIADIPKECNPIYELKNCIVEVNASSDDFNKSEYLREMTGADSRHGTLCAPKVDTAIISVYPRDSISVKHMEFIVSDAKITSLKIWRNNRLLCDVEGLLGRDKYNGQYFFLSGTQKIYRDYDVFIKRTSNYVDGCEKFVETEKTYITGTDAPYYKSVEREYKNECENITNTYLSEINFRSGTGVNTYLFGNGYTLKKIRYEEASGEEVSLDEILFIENPQYVLFKTSIVDEGEIVYMALFSSRSIYIDEELSCDGIFFSHNPRLETIRYGHAFSAYIEAKSNKFRIRDKNQYESFSPSGNFSMSIDSLSNIMLNGVDGANKSISMKQYCTLYDEELEKLLIKRIEQEQEVVHERYERARRAEEHEKAIRDRMVTVTCPECHGSGKIAQTGMGVVLGSMMCPRCVGRGTIEYDPYSPY